MLDCGFGEQMSTGSVATKGKMAPKSSSPSSYDTLIQLPEWLMCNMEHIDVILISNYMSLFALPILLARHDRVKAKIFATAPTVALGRKALEEWRDMARYAAKHEAGKAGNEQNGSHISLCSLASLLNDELIDRCISAIQTVSFHESITLFDEHLTTRAVSSGYCLGSVNWLIENGEQEKIAYLAASSTASTRHPEPLSFKDTLTDADVLLVNDLNRHGMFGNYRNDRQLHELCRAIGMTVSQGGDVLLPLDCAGPLLLDLVENIRTYLQSLNMHLSTIMFCVSPAAEYAFSYSHITSEWMHQQRQARVFNAEAPFPFQRMIKQQQLQYYDKFGQEFATAYQRHHTAGHRAIIFAGHASMKFGPVCKLLEMLDKSSRNAVICVKEPMADLSLRKMRCLNIPLDLRLTTAELVHLVREVRAKRLVLPASHFDHSFAMTNALVQPYTCGNCILEDFRDQNMRQFERGVLNPEIANQLYPQQLQDRLISRVKGAVVEARDGRFIFERATGQEEVLESQQQQQQQQQQQPGEKRFLFGNLNVYDVVRSLQERGLSADEIIVRESPLGEQLEVQLPTMRTTITISGADSTTNIEITHQDPNVADRVRKMLRQLVVDNLVVV